MSARPLVPKFLTQNHLAAANHVGQTLQFEKENGQLRLVRAFTNCYGYRYSLYPVIP